MSHKYDPLFRLLADAKVVTAQVVRECEALGLTTTTDEVKHCHAVLAKIANNVMTKIEAAHVADLMGHKQERRIEGVVQRVEYRHACAANLGDNWIKDLEASGMQPIVIDENTDFSKMPTLNQTENRDDSCPAPAEGYSAPAAADPAPSCDAPDTTQGEN